jgi:hypothetical protein
MVGQPQSRRQSGGSGSGAYADSLFVLDLSVVKSNQGVPRQILGQVGAVLGAWLHGVHKVHRVYRVHGVYRVHKVHRVHRVHGVHGVYRVHKVHRVHRVHGVYRMHGVHGV